ncbi:MAG: CcdB family protein [Microvirga sp.]
MAQFDVYGGFGDPDGYVVNLQTDQLDYLAVRVVAPLIPKDSAPPISRLTPVVHFQGAEYLLLSHQLAPVPVRELHRPIGSLYADQDVIKRALDFLFFNN